MDNRAEAMIGDDGDFFDGGDLDIEDDKDYDQMDGCSTFHDCCISNNRGE
jgi:hypothetical protein